jgi:hypothetical protein
MKCTFIGELAEKWERLRECMPEPLSIELT